IPIPDNSALDTDTRVGVINVDVAPGSGINLQLSNYQFTQLGADSNSPGILQGAFLSQSGTVQLLLGGTGSVSIRASDVDFVLPSGTSGALYSSATSLFRNAPVGDSQAFTSWFNPSNALGGREVATPALAFASTRTIQNAHGTDAAPTLVTLATRYGLTN